MTDMGPGIAVKDWRRHQPAIHDAVFFLFVCLTMKLFMFCDNIYMFAPINHSYMWLFIAWNHPPQPPPDPCPYHSVQALHFAPNYAHTPQQSYLDPGLGR